MESNAPKDNVLMFYALGMLAYAASMMTHEALGHGGFCLLAGGHNAMLTAWGERCSFPNAQPPGIEAAGPALQFAAGLLTWWVLRRPSVNGPVLRYLLWLYMVFNLFVSSGYVTFSGVTDFGDAAVIIGGLNPHWLWRSGLIVLGGTAYFLSMRIAASELKRFATLPGGSRPVFRLVLIPYLSVGVFAVCAAVLNRTMATGVVIGLAAASSIGAGFGMLRLPDMQRGMPTKVLLPDVYIRWSAGWALVAILLIAAFLWVIGPGIEPRVD